MSMLYVITIITAAMMLADDMGMGNIHPVRGAFIMIALVYNVAYTVYKLERKKKYRGAKNVRI